MSVSIIGKLHSNQALAISCKWTKQNQISDVIDCQTSKAHTLAIATTKLFNPNLKLVVHRRVAFTPGTSFANRYKYKKPKVDSFVAISSAMESGTRRPMVLVERR